MYWQHESPQTNQNDLTLIFTRKKLTLAACEIECFESMLLNRMLPNKKNELFTQEMADSCWAYHLEVFTFFFYLVFCLATNDATNFVDPVENIIIAGRCRSSSHSIWPVCVRSHFYIRHRTGGTYVSCMHYEWSKRLKSLDSGIYSSSITFSVSYIIWSVVICMLTTNSPYVIPSVPHLQCECFVFGIWSNVYFTRYIFTRRHHNTHTHTKIISPTETPSAQNFFAHNIYLQMHASYTIAHIRHDSLFALTKFSFFFWTVHAYAIVFRFQTLSVGFDWRQILRRPIFFGCCILWVDFIRYPCTWNNNPHKTAW